MSQKFLQSTHMKLQRNTKLDFGFHARMLVNTFYSTHISPLQVRQLYFIIDYFFLIFKAFELIQYVTFQDSKYICLHLRTIRSAQVNKLGKEMRQVLTYINGLFKIPGHYRNVGTTVCITKVKETTLVPTVEGAQQAAYY